MDTYDHAQNVSLKDESDSANMIDPQLEIEDASSQDTTIPLYQIADNKDPTSRTNSSQDASQFDENLMHPQPKEEDTVSSDAPIQDKAISDQIADSKETTPANESSKDSSEVDANVADFQLKTEGDSMPSDSPAQGTVIPGDYITDDNEVISPKETDSSQDKPKFDENVMDSQPTIEDDTTSSNTPMQDAQAPIDQITNNKETISPEGTDTSQNASELIDEGPAKGDSYIVMPGEQQDPTGGNDNTICPSDSVDNTFIIENKTVISPTEINDSSLIPDKANDNSAVTIDDSVIPPKTDDTPPPSSSKKNNYCAENWLLVLAICLIILIVIATIILALLIVPILSRQIAWPLRLPKNVIPEHYILEIRTHLIPEHFEFDGSVVITILCINYTNKLILHSNGLEIDERSVDVVNLDGGRSPFVLKTEYDMENEFVIFSLCENLEIGAKYDVHIIFKGQFAENLFGFGRTTYEKNGENKHMALTKFESIYARKAFPCFDEPALKATFDINLIRWRNMTSLSNMERLATVERDEDWEVDMYQRSVPMSTYLVTFVVGDLEKIQKGKVSIWAAKDVDNYQLALNMTNALLEFYESYLNVPYSIPKLDQVAAQQYATAAMENWGLVIYNKNTINSEISLEKEIARIISHELAHQWFGNLVTMKWWDELWLNEGFAAYFGYFGANIINRQWKMDEALIQYIDSYMYGECGDHVGPNSSIIEHFESTDKIKGYLRRVVYRKGAALVRMMHMMLGDVVFRRGLKSYLEENSFENVDQDDLWRHLTKAQIRENVIDMKKIMEPWTKQSYFPLVTVTRKYNDHEATIEQTSCTNGLGVESKDLWPVPITWIDGTQSNYRNTSVKLILNSEKGIIGRLPGKETWILVNVERLGYFRVNYDENNWELLLWQLRHNYKVIPMLNRRQLISDALYFAKIKELSHIVALDVITYYPFEKEEMVLETLFTGEPMHYYGSMVKYTDAEKYWKEFVVYLLKPTFIKYGRMWEDEDIERDSRSFRWLSAGILCYEGYTPCLSSARTKFKDVLEGKNLPKSFWYTTIYLYKDLFCALARNATDKEWNYMNQLFRDENYYPYASFLSCTENDQLFQRWVEEYFFFLEEIKYLSLHLSDERWRYMTDFLRTHWKKIKRERFQKIIKSLAIQSHNKETLKMVKQLYELHRNDLSKDAKEDIDRALSAKARLLPSDNAIISVASWLKSRSWENIDIREIE